MKRRLLSMLMVLCMAASLFSALTVSAAADSYETVEHEMKYKETVIGVCKDLGLTYSTCKQAILALNNFSSEQAFRALKAGQTLVFPKTDADAETITKSLVTTKDASGNSKTQIFTVPDGTTTEITVKSNDTMFKICLALGYRYGEYKDIILKLNHFTSESSLNTIRVGQVLTVPADAASAKAIAEANAASVSTGSAASATGTKASASAATTTTGTVQYYLVNYTLESGDMVNNVCSKLGVNAGDYKNVILAVNNMTNLNRVKAGDTMILPSAKAPSEGDYYAVTAFVIASGDTAYKLCQSNGGSYSKLSTIISAINPDLKVSRLKVGDVLLLPLPKTASAAAASTDTAAAAATGTADTSASSAAAASDVPASAVNAVTYNLKSDVAGGKAVFTVNGIEVTGAAEGVTVHVVINEMSGYMLSTITVKDANGKIIDIKGDSFVMPASDVTVTAVCTTA